MQIKYMGMTYLCSTMSEVLAENTTMAGNYLTTWGGNLLKALFFIYMSCSRAERTWKHGSAGSVNQSCLHMASPEGLGFLTHGMVSSRWLVYSGGNSGQYEKISHTTRRKLHGLFELAVNGCVIKIPHPLLPIIKCTQKAKYDRAEGINDCVFQISALPFISYVSLGALIHFLSPLPVQQEW